MSSWTLTSSNPVDCSFCTKMPLKYIYKCTECAPKNKCHLCSYCFERRKSSESHKKNHSFVIISDGELLGCDDQSLSFEELNLPHLLNRYRNETHTNRFKCAICDQNPIKGLRFQCSFCTNVNLCFICKQKHTEDHSLLLYFKTISYKIDMENLPISVQDVVGRGGYGVVIRTLYRNRVVACKIMQSSDTAESFVREIESHDQIPGENIVRMVGLFARVSQSASENYFVILTEYALKGNMRDLLDSQPDLSLRLRLSIAVDIAAGLTRIHSMGYIHRDIKPLNIFITNDYQAKIGDFGIARLQDKDKEKTAIGTPYYMAPEVHTGRYTNKSDIYSYGLTVKELLDNDSNPQVNRLSTETAAERTRLPIMDEIVQKCLIIDQADRRLPADYIYFQIHGINRYINNKLNTNYSNYFETTNENRNEIIIKLYDEALNQFLLLNRQ